MGLNFHEDLKRSTAERGSSDRNFGLVFALFFAVAGLLPLRKGGSMRIWALAVAIAFLAVALIQPAWLRPLNRVWMKLGLLLGRIMNPVVTSILFFVVFTPAGMIARMLGKDPLRLRLEPEADSYWIHRNPPGPPPASMAKQF